MLPCGRDGGQSVNAPAGAPTLLDPSRRKPDGGCNPAETRREEGYRDKVAEICTPIPDTALSRLEEATNGISARRQVLYGSLAIAQFAPLDRLDKLQELLPEYSPLELPFVPLDDDQGDNWLAGLEADPGWWVKVREKAHAAARPFVGLYQQLERCGRKVRPFRCEECGGETVFGPHRCKLRYCPVCGVGLARDLEKRVTKIVARMRSPRFLTLTVPSGPDLKERLDFLRKAFQRLRRSKVWKRYVRGGVAVLEITGGRRRGWHPHVHVIVDGKFIPKPELVVAWQKATGCRCSRAARRRGKRTGPVDSRPMLCAYSTWEDRAGKYDRADDSAGRCPRGVSEPGGQDVRQVTSAKDAAAELAGYVIKSLKNPTRGYFAADRVDDLAELIECTFGRRLLMVFGCCIGWTEDEEPEEAERVCAHCGSDELVPLEYQPTDYQPRGPP